MPLRPPKEPTFTAKQACIALDVPRGTLNWWAHQGLMRDLRSLSTTPGKARRFTLTDVVVLGIMKRLMNAPGIGLLACRGARRHRHDPGQQLRQSLAQGKLRHAVLQSGVSPHPPSRGWCSTG